ncbi:hypothetical protein [Sphingomonas sp. CCH18-H6]|uniref:hypothetical protein n=1 Tax=Sphingomonas sp. CCH18-H6 TaxID=1768787 RepID=UPI000AD077E1|nr:hypothetical protein [Sphingomonas sp. CCH18-H6]
MGALEGAGYLMEQEVATDLKRLGFHVRTNVAFEDPDEGKSREVDVTAVRQTAKNVDAKLAAYVELLVECKNTANPFVFIARPKNEADRWRTPDEFLLPFRYESRKDLGGGRALSREVPGFQHLGFDQVFAAHVNDWKAVQFCRIDRKSGGWHANHGGLYDALFYPMAKALNARRSAIPRGSRPDDWRYLWLFFPIVVTSGPLYLVDSSRERRTPELVDHVSFTRELKGGKVSGIYTVTFVRQQALQSFLSDVVDPWALWRLI